MEASNPWESDISARFNHIIIPAREAEESAAFYLELLEANSAPAWGPFAHVLLDDGVLLQFVRPPGSFDELHFAFLVDDEHFDRALALLAKNQREYWADPQRTMSSQVRNEGDSRGLYVLDPFGHLVELLTRPYI